MTLKITPRDNGSRRVQSHLPSESTVEQAHAGSTNINAIMRKYRKTGQLPMTTPSEGLYGDFAFAADFHEAQNRVLDAEHQFQGMPSEIRKRFNNDAGLFFQFCNDDDNLEEARELGLVPPEPEDPAKAEQPAPDASKPVEPFPAPADEPLIKPK